MKRFFGPSKFLAWSLVTIASLAAFLSGKTAFAAAALPELPRVYVDSGYPDTSAYAQVTVPAGGDFQAAIDRAGCGTVIKLTAGATYTGNFWLRKKNCSDKGIVITTTREAELPPPGTRVKPSDAPKMARIVSPNVAAVLSTEFGASRYRFVGLEVTASIPDNHYLNNLIFLYTDSDQESDLPGYMVFDRLYVHGTPTSNFRRGITPNGRHIAVVDSYISEIHQEGFDSQAVGCWMCPGPLKIVNNHLEGASENVCFGGALSKVPNVVPSDIEIRGNYFYKPLSWKAGEPEFAGTSWLVKNLFETKCTRRMLFEGNVLENNWVEGQAGFAFVLTPRNRYDGPWCVTDDMLFRNNIIRHSNNGMNLSGFDDVEAGPVIANRVQFTNNLWEDIGGAKWGGDGRAYQLLHGPADVTIEHETMLENGTILMIGTEKTLASNFTYRNNLTKYNVYGIHSGIGSNKVALDQHASNYTFTNNVVYLNYNKINHPEYYWMDSEYMAGVFPPGNHFPMDLSTIGFTDYNDGLGGDYTLLPASPYKNAATDGKDIGADIQAVNYATRGAVTGVWDSEASLSPTSQSFEAPGGGGTVRVTSYAGGPWNAASGASWIVIASGASGSGNGAVTYTVAANSGSSPRTGTLAIAGQTFTVTQEGQSCSFSLSPEEQSFSSGEWTGQLSVAGGEGCSWSASSDSPWITILSGSSGIGNGKVQFKVTANPDAGPRTGALTVAGKRFLVNQAGVSGGGVISVAPLSLDFGWVRAGATYSKEVTVSNKGTDPLEVRGITFLSRTLGVFSHEGNCGTLAAGESCTLSIKFSPVLRGTIQGIMKIYSNAGRGVQLRLRGTAR